MNQKKNGDEEKVSMEAILGAALDELDADEDGDTILPSRDETRSHVSSQALNYPSHQSAFTPPDYPLVEEMDQLSAMMKEIFKATNGNSSNDEAFEAAMAKLQQQVKREVDSIRKEDSAEKAAPNAKEEGKADIKACDAELLPARRPVFGPEPPPKETDVDRTINKLLHGMAASATKPEEEAPTMDCMMHEFEKLGGGSMLEGMMQQLLSKDLMYEPIQEVTSKYPKWLEVNKSKLSGEEYENRRKQYRVLKSLMHVYQNEPENKEKLMALMHDVQNYGLPPKEIVSDIAPDIELDEDGVPKLKPDCCIM